jgi:hypothetical protein
MFTTFTWNIWRDGGFYRMRRSDGIEVTPAPVAQLGRALSCHLILAEQYSDVVQQLLTTGRAETTVTVLKGGLRQF